MSVWVYIEIFWYVWQVFVSLQIWALFEFQKFKSEIIGVEEENLMRTILKKSQFAVHLISFLLRNTAEACLVYVKMKGMRLTNGIWWLWEKSWENRRRHVEEI